MSIATHVAIERLEREIAQLKAEYQSRQVEIKQLKEKILLLTEVIAKTSNNNTKKKRK